MTMSYTINQIKVFAYNRNEQKDFTDAEQRLYNGLRYCYDCHRAGYEKEDIEPIMSDFLRFYEFLKNRENTQKGGD